MNDSAGFPFVSKELVEALEQRFPLRKTDIKASEREIWAEVGRQDILDFLKHKHSIQLELSVESSITVKK